MMDGQLMGEFEGEAKELEADSWSLGVEQQYLQQLDKQLVKRQDVIYGTFYSLKYTFKLSLNGNIKIKTNVSEVKCSYFSCFRLYYSYYNQERKEQLN